MSLPKCEHGAAADDGRYTGWWAAPFSHCQCCGIAFPYIDNASFGAEGGHGRSWTKERCKACGGHYVEWDTRLKQAARPLPLP